VSTAPAPVPKPNSHALAAHLPVTNPHLAQAIEVLQLMVGTEPKTVFELRAFGYGSNAGHPGHIASGYHEEENADAIARSFLGLDGRCEAIYYTLNRINPELLQRARNRMQVRPKHATTDADIIERLFLFLDVDPVRPAGLSATGAEHAAALAVAKQIAAYLCALGWPEPLIVDSGNGFQLFFRLPLMDLVKGDDLVRRILLALAARFDTEFVKIDLKVGNRSRIVKLPGSLVRKGDHSAERPHSRACCYRVPERLEPVPIELLEQLAAEAPTQSRPTTASGGAGRPAAVSSFNIDDFLAGHSIAISKGPEAYDGGRRWILDFCFFNPEHKRPAIIQLARGPLVYTCPHASCAHYQWVDVRDLFEPNRPRRTIAQTQPPLTLESAPQANWKDSLLRGRSRTKDEPGPILCNLANAVTALRLAPEWQGVLAFNSFAGEIEVKRSTPFEKQAGSAWEDHDHGLTSMWLQAHGINVPTNIAAEAICIAARDDTFNPLQQYLEALAWDGTPRLATASEVYLGSNESICNTFFRLWTISAVARALRPGSKADCAVVLEGPQGKRKSTALRALAGDQFFSDHLGALGSKDSSIGTRGVWIIELAELDAMNRAEAGAIKAFLSATFDRFRPPYGRLLVKWLRACVFAGSVNDDTWAKDASGGRRFWPIRCGEIDVDAIARDRDQIWAEAVTEYRAGKAWWLEDEGAVAAAEVEQSDRYQNGPWDAMIAAWILNPKQRAEIGRDGYVALIEPFTSVAGSVTTADILTHCIGKEIKNWTRADEMAVAAALRTAGWERFRASPVRTETVETVGTAASREWRYRPRIAQ
jgi:predicted P-loop ATPase